MDMNKSRRDFLRTTGKGLLGVAAVSMLPVGLNTAAADESIGAPAWPWKWEKLDPQEVLEAGYKAFYTHGGCCAGAFAAIIETLAAKFGYPYNQLNARMFANGAGGCAAPWAAAARSLACSARAATPVSSAMNCTPGIRKRLSPNTSPSSRLPPPRWRTPWIAANP